MTQKKVSRTTTTTKVKRKTTSTTVHVGGSSRRKTSAKSSAQPSAPDYRTQLTTLDTSFSTAIRQQYLPITKDLTGTLTNEGYYPEQRLDQVFGSLRQYTGPLGSVERAHLDQKFDIAYAEFVEKGKKAHEARVADKLRLQNNKTTLAGTKTPSDPAFVKLRNETATLEARLQAEDLLLNTASSQRIILETLREKGMGSTDPTYQLAQRDYDQTMSEVTRQKLYTPAELDQFAFKIRNLKQKYGVAGLPAPVTGVRKFIQDYSGSLAILAVAAIGALGVATWKGCSKPHPVAAAKPSGTNYVEVISNLNSNLTLLRDQMATLGSNYLASGRTNTDLSAQIVLGEKKIGELKADLDRVSHFYNFATNDNAILSSNFNNAYRALEALKAANEANAALQRARLQESTDVQSLVGSLPLQNINFSSLESLTFDPKKKKVVNQQSFTYSGTTITNLQQLSAFSQAIADVYHPQTADTNAFQSFAQAAGLSPDATRRLKGINGDHRLDYTIAFIQDYNQSRTNASLTDAVAYKDTNNLLHVIGDRKILNHAY